MALCWAGLLASLALVTLAQATPLTAAQQAQVTQIKALVRQIDAVEPRFKSFRGSSDPCITDVLYTVSTLTDPRGQVRRLNYSVLSMWTGSSTRTTLYWDANRRPRYLSISSLVRSQRSRQSLDAPILTHTKLFIDTQGRVAQRLETGPITAETRVQWPAVLQTLQPAHLIKEFTCPSTR